MPTCIICLSALKNPAALPCGHVFCYDCIVRIVRNVQPYTHQHFCPTCRAPYTITHIDPNLLPDHLRQHFTPAIRKVCLDFSIPSTSPRSSAISECERLRAENASLKSCCEVWRKRASVHAAATLGLVGLTKLARDHVVKIKQEKVELENKYNALKRRYESLEPTPYLPTPPETHEMPRAVRSCIRATSPVSDFRPLSPCPSEESYYSDCLDCRTAVKRRRTSSPIPPLKQSPTTPKIPLPMSPLPAPLSPPAESGPIA